MSNQFKSYIEKRAELARTLKVNVRPLYFTEKDLFEW